MSPYAAGLPSLPLPVRYRVIDGTALDGAQKHDAEMKLRANFELAKQFWVIRAGVGLVWSGATFVADSALANPRSLRSTLDFSPDTAWGGITIVALPSSSIRSGAYAYTYFRSEATPCGPGGEGYGVVLDETSDVTWRVVAHEIGHALGLPHTWRWYSSSPYDPADFLRAMEPFRNDLEGQSYDEDYYNLMGLDFDRTGDHDPFEVQLSPSQVFRARLTIVSRRTPLASIFTYDAFGACATPAAPRPQLADISAAFLATVLG